MVKPPRLPRLGYGIAALACVLALLIVLVLQSRSELTTATAFLAVVIFSAWYGGLGPGLLAALLAAVAGTYLFLFPPSPVQAGSAADLVRLAVLVDVGLLASLLHRERSRAEQTLRDTNLQLITTNLWAQTLAEEASATGQRAAFLAEVSTVLDASLDYETTLNQVAQLAVPSLASWCAVHVVTEDGAVRRVAVTHEDPAKIALFHEIRRRYPLDSGGPHPILEALRTGRSVLYPEYPAALLQAIAQDGEHLRLLQELGFASYMTVPLQSHGQTLGALTLVSAGPERRYGQADLALAEDLARRAALAIENALAYRAEQQARHAAEQTAARVARLQAVTAALSEALTPAQVAAVVVQEGVAALGASAGSLALLTEDGEELEIVDVVGYAPDPPGAGRRFSVSTPLPLADAVRRGEPVWMERPEERAARYPHLAAAYAPFPWGAWNAIPLQVQGRPVGGIGLGFAEPRLFSEEDRSFMLALAQQCAQALERARLYEAEQRARASAVAAEQRLAFLAEASAVLTSSLAYAVTLDRVAHLIVPSLADWCLVDMMAEDGQIRRVAAAHADPTKEELLQEFVRRFPPHWGSPHGPVRVLTSGEAMLVPEITETIMEPYTLNADHRARYRALGAGSTIIVPLQARGQTMGALSLVSATPGRYGPTDLDLALALARRIALAVDNARLYEAEQRTRADAEAAEEQVRRQAARLQALAEASQAFAEASLDLQAVLDTVARWVSESIGGFCNIRLLSDDGQWLTPVAIYHPDPDVVRFAREIFTGAPHHVSEGMAGRVARTGQPLLIPVVPQEQSNALTRPEYLRLRERFPVHGIVTVPLRVQGRVIGTLSVRSTTPEHPYTSDDQMFLQDLADRAALAIENARLYQQAQRLAAERTAIIEQIPSGLTSFDAAGRVVLRNSAGEAITGIRLDHGVPVPETAALLMLRDAATARVLTPEETPIARALAGETVYGEDLLFRRPGETGDRWMQISTVPLRDPAGTITGGIAVFQDITPLKEVERLRQAFLSMAAHELRTPVTSIKGYLQLLLRRHHLSGATEDTPALQIMLQQVNRLIGLVDDLLDVSRLQLGRLELRRATVDLVSLAQDVARRLQPGDDRHPIEVVAKVPALVGEWDAFRLEQVLTNLVENAIKYSPDGGPVTICLHEDNGQAEVAVHDRGIGIPAESRERIFDQFYRADNAGVQTSRSLGVGLYIARGIVERHGGQIRVEAGEDRGSTFVVTLPLRERTP